MRASAIERSGTIVPMLLRMKMRQIDGMSVRSAASPWMFTCQVRPNRLKSLT